MWAASSLGAQARTDGVCEVHGGGAAGGTGSDGIRTSFWRAMMKDTRFSRTPADRDSLRTTTTADLFTQLHHYLYLFRPGYHVIDTNNIPFLINVSLI